MRQQVLWGMGVAWGNVGNVGNVRQSTVPYGGLVRCYKDDGTDV